MAEEDRSRPQTIGDKMLMGSDAPPDRYEKAQGFSVSLMADTPADAERNVQSVVIRRDGAVPATEDFLVRSLRRPGSIASASRGW